jgi:hypothetical protein
MVALAWALVPSTASAASATSPPSPVPAQARTDATVGQATADSPPDTAPCLGMAGVNTCFEVNGDRFWVDDTASDGASAVAQWAVYRKGDGALVNSGQCNQSGGASAGWSKCNHDFTEGNTVFWRPCLWNQSESDWMSCSSVWRKAIA